MSLEQHRHLVGKKLVGDDAQPAADEFRQRDLPAGARVVEDGGMMTMDYRPDRLNVHLDAQRRVRDVTMG